MDTDMPPEVWRKSSRCVGGDCVEVKFGPEVQVRDSKDGTGSVLTFEDVTWGRFVAAVKAGVFDVD